MSINMLKEKVMMWHKYRYPNIDNTPNRQSIDAIDALCSNLLLPIQNQFGEIIVTYGFTSHTLLKMIKKVNSNYIAPNIDQHASYETNSRNKIICHRGGAASDILVNGFEKKMYIIAKWAAENLPLDRMYLYGDDRPIHISYGKDNSRYIQIMQTKSSGKRVPSHRGRCNEFSNIIGKTHEF